MMLGCIAAAEAMMRGWGVADVLRACCYFLAGGEMWRVGEGQQAAGCLLSWALMGYVRGF